MADRFEVVGTVEGLEQRQYRSGDPIPGLWAVRLRTTNGSRTVSFNSTIPVDWENPQGDRRPHPNFALLQEAMATQQPLRIRGTVVEKGGRTYYNGTRAELVTDSPAGEAKQESPSSTHDKPNPGVDMEDAKWAVSVAADAVSLDDADAIEEVRVMAAALLLVARELSEEGVEGIAARASLPDNVHELKQKKRRA